MVKVQTGFLTFVPCLHPAALLYQPGNEESFLRGTAKAVKAAAGIPADPLPRIVLNPDEATTKLWFEAHKDWAFDLETERKNHDIILSWSVGTGDETLVWTWGSPTRGQWEIFKAAFAGPGERIVQNGAFDLPILERYGFDIPWAQVIDTMIAAAIIDPDDYVNLGHLASKHMDVWAWKHEKEDLLPYNGLDSAYTARIWNFQKEFLCSSKQMNFFNTGIMPLLGRVIIPLNSTGIRLDVATRQEAIKSLNSELKNWRSDLQKHFTWLSTKLGVQLSPPIGRSGALSAKQCAHILYTVLGLPEQRHPKTKAITVDKHALAKLRPLDSTGTVGLLLRRSSSKETETHLKVVADADGRVRSRYVLGGDEKHKEFTEKGSSRNRDKGPATGRLASRDPNQQNVPRSARVLYIPTYDDWSFLEGDSSQIELRMTAYFSGDKNLQTAISKDAHLYITWMLDKMTGLYNFNCPYEELHKAYKAGDILVQQARQECKRVSLGWSYRMGAQKLSGTTGISFPRARTALEGLNAVFPSVVYLWDSLVSSVKAQGYLMNPFGRRRYFHVSEVPAICNFLSQSTAADVLFVGQLDLTTRLKANPQYGRLLATVHDSNLLEGPDQSLSELAGIVRSSMEKPISQLGNLSFPIELKVGKNWRDMKPWPTT